MTREQLNDRIEKAKAKVAKIEKRVQKWDSAQCKEAFLKDNEDFIKAGYYTKDSLLSNDWLYDNYIEGCQRELKGAKRNLEKARALLEKYNSMLAMEESIDNGLENNRVEVIWEFLLSYKDMVAGFVRKNMDTLNEYYRVNSEYCEWSNNKYSLIRDSGEESWKEHMRELRDRMAELKDEIHPYTRAVEKYNGYKQPHTVDEGKLEEILMKDCRARYNKLVNEVTKYTGKIVDATNLHISGGELNGIIIGEDGKAKVNTFMAGIYHIVQCPHYRTKVTRVD